jgi:Protein of unknown function (DUF2510)
MTRRQWVIACLAWASLWLALAVPTLGLTLPLAVLSVLAMALPVGTPKRVIVTNPPRQLPSVPAGWYPDGRPSMLRWWNGTAWTEHTHRSSDP